MPPTRRDLIRLASGGAALSQTGLVRSQSAPAPSGTVSVWTTAGEERFASRPPVSWRAARDTSSDAVVLDPSRKFQETCYLINQLSETSRAALLNELLHPSKLGLSVFRICIGSSDYATEAYSFDEGGPDPELARFSIERDRKYLLPVLKQARGVNPDLFLLASPWSPPGWMKANGSMLGGSMHKHDFAAYAKCFVKFLQAYEAAGVPVQAVTIQNEVDTDQDGRMPACLWGQEYETEFVARHLGPQFAANKIDTRIWILDHNYNLWGRAMASLEEPAVNRYVDGVAWHGYLGRPSAMSRVKEAHP